MRILDENMDLFLGISGYCKKKKKVYLYPTILNGESAYIVLLSSILSSQ